MNAAGKKFAIIVSRWNELITKELLEGALDEFMRHGSPDVLVVHVPGAWEIPVAAAHLIKTPDHGFDGLVALGCIMQGATTHAGMLAADVASTLMRLQVDSGVPVSWGVLTPENQDQAVERAGLKLGNKGREAALSAIEMAALLSSEDAD